MRHLDSVMDLMLGDVDVIERDLRKNHGLTLEDAMRIIIRIGPEGFDRIKLAAEVHGLRLCDARLDIHDDGLVDLIRLPPEELPPPLTDDEKQTQDLQEQLVDYKRMKRLLDRERRRASGFGR